MATLNWFVTKASANPNAMDAFETASGQATTSTSAANVSGLTPSGGEVVSLTASAAMWVRFGGRTAAVGTGIPIAAGETKNLVVPGYAAGAVSAIDEA